MSELEQELEDLRGVEKEMTACIAIREKAIREHRRILKVTQDRIIVLLEKLTGDKP